MKQKKNILEITAVCASLAAASAAAGCASGCAVQRYAEAADGTRLEVVAETDASGVEKFYVVGADGSRAEISADAVREETVLDPDVKEAAASVAESALSAASEQGGVLGAIGAGLLALWGLFKSRKTATALSAASALASGALAVIDKLKKAQAAGEPLDLGEDDAEALLAAVKADEATRAAVKKLLASLEKPAAGAAKKLWDFLF